MKADLILHPVRLRIVTELAGKQLSPRQLGEALPDIAQATLYRHLNTLLDGKILKIVSEHPVNGAIERIYTVIEGAARLSDEELRGLSRGDHLRYFTVFAASLIDSFAEYIDTCDLAGIGDDGMSYNRAVLYLDAAERQQFQQEVVALIGRILSNQPTPDRKRFTLASIVIPDTRNES
ncbi:MAG: helix-turn-helix domain-containing protein [Chloroflexota bacterium]|nr:helix-turn-helix domain-containing protein [Chloroflexota bacterium]